MASQNARCLCIEQCMQTKRIIHALKYYQSLKITDKNCEDALISFCEGKYKQLINDYNHIVMCHDIHQFIHSLTKITNL